MHEQYYPGNIIMNKKDLHYNKRKVNSRQIYEQDTFK